MITAEPIGYVHSARTEPLDDDWDAVPASIELVESIAPAALDGIEAFSHAEVIFFLDRVPTSTVEWETRHPRGNPDWPKVGIFAQRGRARPNRLGLTIVEILGRERRVPRVRGLDAVDSRP